MSKPLKAGCLALVVGTPISPENNGKTVRLVEFLPENAKVMLPTAAGFGILAHDSWWVEGINGPLVWRKGPHVYKVPGRPFHPRYLVRIDADPDDVTIEEEDLVQTP